MTCAAWAALAALAAPRLRRLRLDVHCTGGAYSLRCSTPTPTAARCVLLQRRWRLWLLNALFCSDSTRAALAALAATPLRASSAGFVGLGVPMLASTQARPTAAEHLRRRKLDVCCSSGAGNTGCSTVTSAAARWVLRGRRSQLAPLRIYACGSTTCAASAALAALAAQLPDDAPTLGVAWRRPFGVATS